MFVVHEIYTDKLSTSRDYGHVNQFFRHNPMWREVKSCEVFKECIKQGFIYIQIYMCHGKYHTTYHKTLAELKAEVDCNLHTRPNIIGE